MGCEHFKIGDGVAIVCSRGRRSRKRCSVAGCTHDATKLCDFPLSGRKAGKTCDRALCAMHAAKHGDSVDYCPTHAEIAREGAGCETRGPRLGGKEEAQAAHAPAGEARAPSVPRTALDFAAAGVEIDPRADRVLGPEGREDLREAFGRELGRRMEAFAKQLPFIRDEPAPRVALVGVTIVRTDQCDACGDALAVGRGGMCALCELAWRRVLKNEGRI